MLLKIWGLSFIFAALCLIGSAHLVLFHDKRLPWWCSPEVFWIYLVGNTFIVLVVTVLQA